MIAPNSIQFSLTDAQYAPWRTVVNAVGLATMEPMSNPLKGYRPKIWDTQEKAMFYMEDNEATSYFFDAVLKTEHVGTRRLTTHPIQTGSAITDHSYRIPSTLTMEIGVSDAMDCYSEYFDWKKGYGERSVNAYQALAKLRDSGEPLDVTTRLYVYKNMVIESLSAIEEYKTRNELRATVRFTEIIIAEGISSSKESIDPQVHDMTGDQVKPTTSVSIEDINGANLTTEKQLLAPLGGG